MEAKSLNLKWLINTCLGKRSEEYIKSQLGFEYLVELKNGTDFCVLIKSNVLTDLFIRKMIPSHANDN